MSIRKGGCWYPRRMRKAMKVENQQVWLEHQKGHIKLFGAEVYEERKQRAAQNRADKLKAFEREGAAVRRCMHVPVMLPEALEYLALRPDGIYIDVTAGLGGHTGAIAQRLTSGKVLSLDRDAESMEMARANVGPADRAASSSGRPDFRSCRRRQPKQELRGGRTAGRSGCEPVSAHDARAGLFVDGVGPGRHADGSQPGAGPPREIVNTVDERSLANLIFEYAEERRSRQIARAIVRARPIRDTAAFSGGDRVGRAADRSNTSGDANLHGSSTGGQRRAGRTRQPAGERAEAGAPGGRIVVITFMSLEDRKVKQSFQELAREGRARILTKHVVRPSEQEVRENAPSRSAKLRAVEMLSGLSARTAAAGTRRVGTIQKKKNGDACEYFQSIIGAGSAVELRPGP